MIRDREHYQTQLLDIKYPNIKVDPLEDLNLDNMIKETLQKVLDDYRKYPGVRQRAYALGISERTYHRYMAQYFPDLINPNKTKWNKLQKSKKADSLTSMNT